MLMKIVAFYSDGTLILKGLRLVDRVEHLTSGILTVP